MASLRALIRTSLVDLLDGISRGNGHNTDVAVSAGGGGAHKVLSRNKLEKLPTLIVSMPEEDKGGGDEARDNRYTVNATFVVLCLVAENPDEPIEDTIDELVADVEKVLLEEDLKPEALGTPAVQRIHVDGHFTGRGMIDGRAVLGAELFGRIEYTHNVDSSERFG